MTAPVVKVAFVWEAVAARALWGHCMSGIGGLEMARAIVGKKASGKAAAKPPASPVAKAKPKAKPKAEPKASKAGRPRKPATAQLDATTLPVAMTGRASPAKAALGDKPVFAYISSLPQPQRGIAERVDALAAKTLPDLQRCVKWGMALLWRRRRLVLLLRRLRRPRQAHVRARHVTQARTTGDADRDGQGLAGRGPRIGGRPRRTPGRGVDETGHGHPRLRGEEAMSRSFSMIGPSVCDATSPPAP